MRAIEQLGYRVTVGDVAASAGMELNAAQQGLLALATDAGGHLQVSTRGDIAYLFPTNFRTILRNKYWQLGAKETFQKAWRVLFYLIRISFGIILILSILMMAVAIAAIAIGLSSSRDGDRDSGSDFGGGAFFFPSDIFLIFSPRYGSAPYNRPTSRQSGVSIANEGVKMNFLEGIFSFLFGDGNPNSNLEGRRWQAIGSVIQNNGGAIAAPQLAPYFDNEIGADPENEDYILPVLSRFNGYPQVSPLGDIIYSFPELQVRARKRNSIPVDAYLQEQPYHFSEAGSGQKILAAGLGGLNIVLAMVLGSLLSDPMITAQLGGFLAFVHSIYGLLLGYAIAFLSVPTIRYFAIQSRNRQIARRNNQRKERAEALRQDNSILQRKIDFAQQFAAEKTIDATDVTYSTEQDLLEQDAERSDAIDREWRHRLESS
jgi:hypothetical protein